MLGTMERGGWNLVLNAPSPPPTPKRFPMSFPHHASHRPHLGVHEVLFCLPQVALQFQLLCDQRVGLMGERRRAGANEGIGRVSIELIARPNGEVKTASKVQRLRWMRAGEGRDRANWSRRG